MLSTRNGWVAALAGTCAGAVLALTPAQAQYGGGYGGGGYGGGEYGGGGGGYDRRAPDDDFDRPRRRRDEFDAPRRGGGDGGGAPQARGAFVQSCRDIQQDGFYLEASCRERGGSYRRTRIDIRACRSVGNNNGRLSCER